MGCTYYYDNVREHSALSYQTPFSYLEKQLPHISDKIRFVIPIMLDEVSVNLGPWSGYHVLAQHLGAVMSHVGARVLAVLREDKPYELRNIDGRSITREEVNPVGLSGT